VTTLARVVFALLVAATFGAFFAAQRLKHTPPVVQAFRATPWFSPNGDGRFDRERISFRVKHTDDVTVEVVNPDGEVVRTLMRNGRMLAYRQLPTLRWNGRTDDGGRARDGSYRVRVTLRREGRSVVVPRSFRLDTRPPKPRLTAIGPQRDRVPRPELLPNREGRATIHTRPAGRHAELLIFRTAPGRPRLVSRHPLRAGQTTSSWSGRVGGRGVSPGTYLAVARWRDQAGNVGSSVPLDRRGLPAAPFGEPLPGHGGITVRYLEMQPPTQPVAAGEQAEIGVDARGACYRWELRRVGQRQRIRFGRSCHTPFHIHAPGAAGVYLFEAHTATRRATVPLPVSGGPSPSRVLVVLPVMTWQGRNPVDDDGDGAADTLERGVAVRAGRVLQAGRLPAGFANAEGPLLAFLARNGRRFDVTTDVALALGRGPKLGRYRGVILPGDVRWLPARTGLLLRRWVRAGGGLLAIGTDSLRREVRVSPRGRLVGPTAAAQTDLFGARVRPVVRKPTTVTNLEDQLQLFSGDVVGGTGVFAGFPGYEETAALGASEQLAASAVTEDAKTVVVAARFGKGLVIRTGLLDFATRLSADDNSAQLVLRAWTLIGRR
jgi:hypothetical protein